MKIKKVQLILMGLIFTMSVNAQLIVKINGKEVKSGEEIVLADAKTMEMSFKKPKKITDYTSGRSSVYMKIMSENDEVIALYDYTVDGYTASNNFLYPSTPVYYSIWVPDNGVQDMKLISGNGITHFRKNLTKDVRYRRLKVTTHLTFEESISWDKYGKPQILLEPMTFYLEVWSKTNKLSMPEIGATYTYPGAGEYQNMEYSSSSGSSYGTGKKLTDDGKYRIKTTTADGFNIQTVSLSGSQDNELANLKTNFETYLKYIANTCNGKKVLKNITVPDYAIDWSDFTGYDKETVLADLDQTNNANHASVKLVENVTVGPLTGLKFTGIQKSYKCSTKDAVITTIEGPADPSKQKYEASIIFYLLKHPTQPNKLIAVSYRWVDNNSGGDVTAINKNTAVIEEFLSALTF